MRQNKRPAREERGLEERARVSGPGLRTFLNIAARWGLTDAEQLRVLGSPSPAEFQGWIETARAHDALVLSTDVLMRISAVLGIFGSLRTLYATKDGELRWLHCSPTYAPYAGRSPMSFVLDGSLDRLMVIRSHLLAACQHTNLPPNEVDHDFTPHSDGDIRWR